jgi:hypothetical protein
VEEHLLGRVQRGAALPLVIRLVPTDEEIRQAVHSWIQQSVLAKRVPELAGAEGGDMVEAGDQGELIQEGPEFLRLACLRGDAAPLVNGQFHRPMVPALDLGHVSWAVGEHDPGRHRIRRQPPRFALEDGAVDREAFGSRQRNAVRGGSHHVHRSPCNHAVQTAARTPHIPLDIIGGDPGHQGDHHDVPCRWTQQPVLRAVGLEDDGHGVGDEILEAVADRAPSRVDQLPGELRPLSGSPGPGRVGQQRDDPGDRTGQPVQRQRCRNRDHPLSGPDCQRPDQAGHAARLRVDVPDVHGGELQGAVQPRIPLRELGLRSVVPDRVHHGDQGLGQAGGLVLTGPPGQEIACSLDFLFVH